MAKKAILDLLETTIGQYVLDIDPKSLNVAIWGGNVQLHNLRLDTEAINGKLRQMSADQPGLSLPLRVSGGGVGFVEVEVPWTKIGSKSVVMRLTDLEVIVEPDDADGMVGTAHASEADDGDDT
eukprot:CAMPEP_0194331756 /NCGR_PEP_ID=MMETSP0171-20130528/56778_1 /TAXON_ID=218684 /ORGANISM="Corethron pennatum, Strain L29A3" /LENGTH=123 /DNA_ID=CAMNT_0039093359 /DNA_START=100 /DNA_END=467 /DNA_ORIENTATION=-